MNPYLIFSLGVLTGMLLTFGVSTVVALWLVNKLLA